MIFFGASGHAKVVIEAWITSGGKVTAVFDDATTKNNILGYNVQNHYKPEYFEGKEMCISIGSNLDRRKIAKLFQAIFKSVVHQWAFLSPSAKIGDGSVVMAGVVVNSGARIGNHVILNSSSVIEHDCLIEDFAHISPHATICGGVLIGEGSHVGAGATIIQNITIGKWTTIGAGSVIVKDIPDFAVVTGVPGKIIRFSKA